MASSHRTIAASLPMKDIFRRLAYLRPQVFQSANITEYVHADEFDSNGKAGGAVVEHRIKTAVKRLAAEGFDKSPPIVHWISCSAGNRPASKALQH